MYTSRMVTFRLTQNKENSKLTWTVTKGGDPNEFTIITWKGTYEIDNYEPTDTDAGGNIWYRDLGVYFRDFSPDHVMMPYLWVDKKEAFVGDVYVMHPLKRYSFWVKAEEVQTIVDDIEKWILEQPPSPDHEGVEKDKKEVEEMFTELEQNVQTKK